MDVQQHNVVTIRLSDDEAARLKAMTDKLKVKRGTLVRQLLMSALDGQAKVTAWSVELRPTDQSFYLPN